MSKDVIPPGGEGEIKAILRTEGRQGPINKRITVMSDDPAKPQLILTLDGEIVVDVAIEPSRLGFGDVGRGEKGSQEFSIKVTEPDKIKITKLSIEDKRFTVVRKGEEPKGNTKYELKFAGEDKIGRIHTQLNIEYSGSEVSKLDVPIRASVVGDLVYRKNISFFKKEGKFSDTEITIASRSGKPVKILGLEDPDKRLKLEVEKNKKGKEGALIKAGVIDQDAVYDKILRGKVVVKTSIRSEPDVEIDYNILDRSLSARPPRMPGINFGQQPAQLNPSPVGPQPTGPAPQKKR